MVVILSIAPFACYSILMGREGAPYTLPEKELILPAFLFLVMENNTELRKQN